jgi:hypothetical protein
MNRRNKK